MAEMLHIVNKSPLERNSLAACLRIAAPGAAILLIEDAVYAATRGTAVDAQVKEAIGRFRIGALLPDLEARAVADRVIPGVTPIDYGGFVDLVAANRNCQSWL
jgi:tRNA 2-thiouridine synthesizing protein B